MPACLPFSYKFLNHFKDLSCINDFMDPSVDQAQRKREEAQRLQQEADLEEARARELAEQEKAAIDEKYGTGQP